MKPLQFAIVIEKGQRNYSAYVPDLPGCVATGHTRRQVEARLRKAIVMHVAGMLEDGLSIPKPSTTAGSVRVAIPVRPTQRAAG
ncbi:MAG: type II toxin-antitoxin system HicB family antitoxin [SAR324 cluster bacterium]